MSFQHSITTWHRLEGRTRGYDIDRGLEARLHDPLWLLGRQRQLGEFRGDDAGSPVYATATLTSSPMSAIQCEGGSVQSYDPSAGPIEALVAGEALDQLGTPRRSAALGQAFLRLLSREGLDALASRFMDRFAFDQADYSLAPGDQRGARLLRMLHGRALDGAALWAELTSLTPTSLVASLGVPSEHVSAVEALLGEWVAAHPSWAKAPSAWVEERLEHRFTLGAPGFAGPGSEVALHARSGGGRLDWHSYDLRDDLQLGPAGSPSSHQLQLQPTQVRYPGMPLPRFWAIEDHAVDFAMVTVEGGDIGRMLFVEFALTTGDDWFLLPARLPYGTVTRIETLTVTDTFGVQTVIPAVDTGSGGPDTWSLFRPTRRASASDSGTPEPLLVLPPVAHAGLEGEDLEQVLLVHDELANLAWGVERTVEGGDGRPLGREGRVFEPRPPAGEGLSYRLFEAPPDNWVPLVPVIDNGRCLFRRGTLPLVAGEARPQGFLLAGSVSIHASEIDREGVRLGLRFSRARGERGETWTWLGRRAGVGEGGADSGLRFDRV